VLVCLCAWSVCFVFVYSAPPPPQALLGTLSRKTLRDTGAVVLPVQTGMAGENVFVRCMDAYSSVHSCDMM
jgi:hypothetical protein